MIRRNALFLVIGTLAVLGCIRLGIWQLDRLSEKREANATVSQRLTKPPIAPELMPNDTSQLRHHRVAVSGTFDFDNEIVLTSRVRQGAPGAWILTPLRREGNDTAVLVNRGWVYSADGATVELQAWREPATASVSGYTERYSGVQGRPVSSSLNPRAVHRVDLDSIRQRFPYPVAPYIVVWTDTAAAPPATRVPERVGFPSLGEGSHLSYAVQWFSFAAIGVIGMVAFLRARGRNDRTRQRS